LGTFPVIILALVCSQAAAQDRPVVTAPERSDTIKVFISGRIEMDYVWRSRELTAFTNSFSNPTHDPALPFFPNPATSDSEDTFEGQWAVRLDARLTSGASVVAEIGRRRAELEQINRYGETGSMDVILREARGEFDDLLVPGLSAELGITTWSFNPRGKGGSLAFEPRGAHSSHESLHGLGDINQRETADARLGNAGFPEELQPMGGVFQYGSGPLTFEVVILPTVLEGGRPKADESLYAVDLYYALPEVGEGSRIGLIVANNSLATDPPGALPGVPANEHADIWTIGGGFDLRLFGGALEIYGETYFQTGKASETALGDRIDAAGRAFRGGIEWNHKVGNPMPIWAGLSFMHLSGDDDDDPNDDEANRFSAYEAVSDLLILENMYYGYDWESNYEAFKIYAGLRTSFAGGENNLELTAMAGFTKAAEEVGAPGALEDDLGREFDVRARWDVSRQFAVHLSMAFLTGSDVLENAMDAGVPGSNPDASDRATLFVLGMDLSH
jgi:hypothetical protein